MIEETIYILMKLTAMSALDIEEHYKILKRIKTDESIYKLCLVRAEEFYHSILDEKIIIITSLPPWEVIFELMRKYRLLPNDALIAATCKYYGIRKIATFDEDFDRVGFLERVKAR